MMNHETNFDFQSKFISQDKPKAPSKFIIAIENLSSGVTGSWHFIRGLSPKTLAMATLTLAAATATIQAPPYFFHYLETKSLTALKQKEIETKHSIAKQEVEMQKVKLAQQEKDQEIKAAQNLAAANLFMVKKITPEEMQNINAWVNTQRTNYNRRLDELVTIINIASKKDKDYDSKPALTHVAKLRNDMNTHYYQRLNELNQTHSMLSNGMDKSLPKTYDNANIIELLLWWNTATKVKIEAPFYEIDDYITKWAPFYDKS